MMHNYAPYLNGVSNDPGVYQGSWTVSIETGRPIADVARDLGVNHGTVGNWMKAWRHANPEPDPVLSPVERARVSEMEAEIRRLRMENEFLKKQRPSSPGRPSG